MPAPIELTLAGQVRELAVLNHRQGEVTGLGHDEMDVELSNCRCCGRFFSSGAVAKAGWSVASLA